MSDNLTCDFCGNNLYVILILTACNLGNLIVEFVGRISEQFSLISHLE